MQQMHSATVASVDRLFLLEVFLSLTETKSVTGTARRLGVSQSTVSRMLQRLESMAQVPLVRRASRGVSLTREGEHLARSAPAILESWSAALECGREAHKRLSGTLRVVAPVAIGQGMLAIVFSRFLLQHPALSLELELRDDPIDLQAMKYDLWIRVGAAPDSLVVQHIFKVDRWLVAAPGITAAEHPQALAQVRAIRLRPFTPRAIELTHSSGQSLKLVQNVALTSDHLETVRVAALEGLGYAVLPLWAVKRDLQENKLVRLCAGWQPPSLRLSLAFLPNAKRSARARELILFIRDELTRPDGVGMSYLRRQEIADTVQVAEGAALGERYSGNRDIFRKQVQTE
jgi:DNA-binding transcriptional LysR family regulator